MIKRYCLAFDLRNDPALIRQYRYVHSKEGMWPAIPKGIKAVGIFDMEIYLSGTRMYMILETPTDWDYDSQMALCGTLEKQAEWNEYVWQFQQRLPYAKNGEKWMHMEKVFHLHPIDNHGSALTGYPEKSYTIPTKRWVSFINTEQTPDQLIPKDFNCNDVLDLQLYQIGTRICLIAETLPDFNWQQNMPPAISANGSLMEKVFDLDRDFE